MEKLVFIFTFFINLFREKIDFLTINSRLPNEVNLLPNSFKAYLQNVTAPFLIVFKI